MSFGKKINRKRLEKDLSLRDLATLTGLDHSYIARLEKGGPLPSRETVTKLSGALDIPADELMMDAGYLPEINELGALGADGYINKYGYPKPLEKKQIIADEKGGEYMPRPASCGERIALIREGLGISQEDLAAKTGISLSKLIDYEDDKTFPSAGDIKAIADNMGFEPSFFILSAEKTSEVNERAYKNHITKWKHKGYAPEDIDRILEKWEAILEITKMSNNGEI